MLQLKSTKRTKWTHFPLLITVILSSFMIACDKDDDDTPPPPAPQATVVSGAGELTAVLTQFRGILGDPLNSTPNQATGRREVNWDGVPANFTNSDNFPFDFFNLTDPAGANGRKRGLVYANAATAFRVDSSDFAEIDASYADQFDAFSGKRTFVTRGSVVTEIVFKVPGTNTDAFVKGFGAVFSDVDDANSTKIEFYNGTKSLGVFKAPVRAAGSSFSFLGVFFPGEKVTKVKITAGNGLLAAGVKDISNNGTYDLVVMDDLFYNEPLNNQ